MLSVKYQKAAVPGRITGSACTSSVHACHVSYPTGVIPAPTLLLPQLTLIMDSDVAFAAAAAAAATDGDDDRL